MSELRRDVVEFIKEVEKRECIYNTTMPEYSNRNETKRAWGEVAEFMNCTESECKEKWRKLRIAFMRSLKHMKASNLTNKPYYLYDYLTFLLPYVKVGEQQTQDHDDSSLHLSPDHYEDEEIVPKKTKVEIDSDNESRNDMNHHYVDINDISIGRSNYETQQRLVKDRKRKKTEDVEDNPRKMFLLSILPDIESLSDQEMRLFRRTVVDCIDHIYDARKRIMKI